MITKINNTLINIDVNKFNSTKQMYLSLWKEIYNIKLSNNSTNINNFKQYIHNKNIYI
jgi:hypothetical protein